MRYRLPTMLILLVMVLTGAMYWVDIAYNTDPDTGFLFLDGLWKRALVLCVPLVMALLGMGTLSAKGIGVLRVKNRLLAGLFVAAAAVGVACGLTQALFAFADSSFSLYRLLMGLSSMWYGLWMFLVALQMLLQNTPSPTGSAIWGVLAALPFCVLTVYRVVIKPTSLYRAAPLVASFAALCAMLWMGNLLQGLYVALPPRRLRGTYLLGLCTFLFATCLELPQAVFAVLFKTPDPLALMESINLGVLGLVAGCMSVAMAGMRGLADPPLLPGLAVSPPPSLPESYGDGS